MKFVCRSDPYWRNGALLCISGLTVCHRLLWRLKKTSNADTNYCAGERKGATDGVAFKRKPTSGEARLICRTEWAYTSASMTRLSMAVITGDVRRRNRTDKQISGPCPRQRKNSSRPKSVYIANTTNRWPKRLIVGQNYCGVNQIRLSHRLPPRLLFRIVADGTFGIG